MWVADVAGPSDLIRGLGMLGGSAHRHLDVTFRLVTGEPSPLPPEQPEQPLAPPELIGDPDTWVFEAILESYTHVDDLLWGDRKARKVGLPQEDGYYAALEKELGASCVDLMYLSAQRVSSVWLTAWVRAGRPVPPGREPAGISAAETK